MLAVYNRRVTPNLIYLDHNATTPLAPEVAAAMDAYRRRGGANPASPHAAGRAARRVLEDARARVAGLLGARTAGLHADRIVFTSGGTEANTLALRGLAGAPPKRVIVSAIEHPSVAMTAEQMRREGFRVDRLGVDWSGVVRLDELADLLADDAPIGVVSVMLGNNETGALQPLREIVDLCSDHSVPVHTDAVQAVGKIPVGFEELGITALSFTAHKFHGPIGVGGLIVKADAVVAPQLFGGFQQAGLRPGTEAVDLAVGLTAALDLWAEASSDRAERMARLRDRLEASVAERFSDVVRVAAEAPRLPHTSCLAFPGVDRQALLMSLDQAGIACSTGSACASGSSEPSPVLLAMGLSNDVVQGAIRLSLGAGTTVEEIDAAASRISRAANGLRSGKTA